MYKWSICHVSLLRNTVVPWYPMSIPNHINPENQVIGSMIVVMLACHATNHIVCRLTSNNLNNQSQQISKCILVTPIHGPVIAHLLELITISRLNILKCPCFLFMPKSVHGNNIRPIHRKCTPFSVCSFTQSHQSIIQILIWYSIYDS